MAQFDDYPYSLKKPISPPPNPADILNKYLQFVQNTGRVSSSACAYVGVLGDRPTGDRVRPGVDSNLLRFLEWIAENEAGQKGNYDFELIEEIRPPQAGSYVSVLRIQRDRARVKKKRTMVIYCNKSRLLKGLFGEDSQYAKDVTKFSKSGDKVAFRKHCTALSKILLHEASHALLHLPDWEQQKDWKPTANAPQEKEAWVYSLRWWGLLMGELAYDAVTQDSDGSGTETDITWIIA